MAQNAQQKRVEHLNEEMNLNSIAFCSPPGRPVWLKLKLGVNRLGEAVRIWDEATGRGLTLRARGWVATCENALQQKPDRLWYLSGDSVVCLRRSELSGASFLL